MKLTRTRKRLLGVAVVAALLGGGSAAFAATDAPAGAVFSDTSVQIFDNPIPLQSIDAITSIADTATYQTCSTVTCPGSTVNVDLNGSPTLVPSFSTATVKYTAVDTASKPLTYSIVNTVNLPSSVGLTISNSGNTGNLMITPIPAVSTSCPYVSVDNPNPISATVKVTDGTAVGFETLTANPTVVDNPTVGCPGDRITQISVTATTDTVTLAGTNDNTTGRVDFAPAPAGVTFTGANLPAGTGGNPGVTLAGNVLSATSTIPGVYNDIAVTATDTAGATATDTFDVYVKGAVAGSSIPRLSGGRATEGINPSRENVSFIQNNAASCDHFTIVGPGAINGHQGWVPGNLGLNVAVYGGLLQHHGYTVYYQPVSGPLDCSTHSTTPWPGAHWGYVFFVTA